jgi:tetratricopeptide (TPR) repeat protein
MMDCQIFGLKSGGHHLVNVLLHAANAVLLFLVLRQLTGCLWRSAMVAALFAVHPLRAESVAWVSERKDVLSALFFLLAIGAYVRQVRRPSKTGPVLLFVWFALGLLAKSMVATLPAVLLLLDYWPLGRWRSRRDFLPLAREKAALFALGAGACAAAALVPGLVVLDVPPLPLPDRLGNALVSCAAYLGQMVFPVGLAFPYPLPPKGQPLGQICLAFALLAAISAAVFVWRKKRPYLLAGWLWYLGMLAPVLGIVQISTEAARADRYTYLPGIGLALAVVWALADWSASRARRRAALGGLMVAAVGTLAVGGCLQTSHWKDSESLWRHSLDNAPGNHLAHYCLGNALLKQGKVGEAIQHFQQALAIRPDLTEARYNLANSLVKTGKLDEAVLQYRKVLETKPDDMRTRNSLGNALVAEHKLDEAIAELQAAVEIKPDDLPARNNLGNMLFARREPAAAIAQFQKAVEIDPASADTRNNLGNVLFSVANWDAAAAQYKKALEIRHAFPNARHSLVRSLLRKGDLEEALSYAAAANHPNADASAAWVSLGNDCLQQQELDEAILCYRQAASLNPRCADAFANLGVALINKGKAGEAMISWEKALDINPRQLTVLNNLAWLLATAPDSSVRDGAKAVALATQASQITGGGNPAILHTLAAACAKAGDFDLALDTARRALRLAEAQKQASLAATLQMEIKLYEAHTPLSHAPR